ncbi:MAG: hypothetical protein D6689_20375 [Deltaproteobacteria bacterium]|nr:MAG: hypothetical protein D6689_20375 [Deltaproteobacteria bacterium]
MIEREARRIRDIVQTLQGFSQEFAGEGMAAVDVRGVVDAAVEMVAARVDRGEIELVCDHAADLPPIRGNAGQLRQAVLHVLTNAIAATPPGGRVTASTRSVEGGAVRVAVSDTGAGIAPEILDRIFEPFFTTKQEWEGRGLGLTVVYRIVEEHGGSIHVDSEVGRGTTVAIVLPAARGGAHLV